MNMRRKVVLGAVFVVFLLIVFPIAQIFFFNQQTSGRIVANKLIEASYLKEVKEGLFIVYFGYVGCEKVCTPILHDLNMLYQSEEFGNMRKACGLVFVNLMPEVSPDEPDIFAKLFNSSFQGVYLTQRELMGIDRDFNVFFSKSLSEPGLIDHSDYIYLMEKRKDGKLILKNIYMTHPLNKKQIVDDISKLAGKGIR